MQRDTKTLADHFNSIESLSLIYNDKLDTIQIKVKAIILISFVAFIASLVTLFYSFGFLSNQKCSFIPISAVFLISLSLITIALYIIKYKVITKAINNEIRIDKRLLKLIIYQKIQNEKNTKNDDDKMK